MANPIAELVANLGFRYNKKPLQQFQKDLKQTANHINSKTSGSIGGATKQAKAEQSSFYQKVMTGYGKAKPSLKDHQRNLLKIREGLKSNRITTQEYGQARIRVLNAINTREKKIHRDRLARYARERKAQPYAGGRDPRQAGDHRLISAIHSDVGLGILAGGFAAAQSVRAYQDFVGARQGIAAAMGGEEAGQEEMDWLIKTSNRLGVSLTAAADGYKGLAAATKNSNLEGRETRRIFEAVASYSKVLNLSLDDQKGVFRALTQMQSKGVVNAEELSQQFGERLPGGYEAAARAMKMTTAELRKATEQGEITAEELFPKLSTELLKMANSGGQLEKALNNTNSAINRFSNNVIIANKRFNESGFDKTIRDLMNTMSDAIDKAEPLWKGLGAASEFVIAPLRAAFEMFGAISARLDMFGDAAEGNEQKIKLFGIALSMLFSWSRKLLAVFLLIPAAMSGVAKIIDGEQLTWKEWAVVVAGLAASLGLVLKSLKSIRGIGGLRGPKKDARAGGGSAADSPDIEKEKRNRRPPKFLRRIGYGGAAAVVGSYFYDKFKEFNARTQEGGPLIFRDGQRPADRTREDIQRDPLIFKPEKSLKDSMFMSGTLKERIEYRLNEITDLFDRFGEMMSGGPEPTQEALNRQGIGPNMPSSFGPAGMMNSNNVNIDRMEIVVGGGQDGPDSIADRIYERFNSAIRDASMNSPVTEK